MNDINEYFKGNEKWKDFNPNLPLSEAGNSDFMKQLSNDIFQYLFNDNLDISEQPLFSILTIWDFQKKELPQFEKIFSTEIDNKRYDSENPGEYGPLYEGYIKKLEENKDGTLHFWDILHKYKKFCSPIRIFKEGDKIKCAFLHSGNSDVENFTKENWLWVEFEHDKDFSQHDNKLESKFDNLVGVYYDSMFEAVKSKDETYCDLHIYEIPLFFTIEKATETSQQLMWYRSVGALSIGLKKQNDGYIENLVPSQVKEILTSIVTKQYQAYAHQQSIKSAIAAIMSRNMSHNLGSHVITNTKSDIIEIAEANPSHARELLGLASLLHYLQERQDFIAVVTGDERYAKTGINFKAHVFDMLAYDGPALRHKTSTTPQQKNYILDNIVRSENYDRNNIELILEIPDSANKGSENYIQLESKHSNDASNAFNNIFLSIPYGINGRQGFLAILENFIRNSAKHEKDSNLRELNFTIRIEDKEGDNGKKQITIYDNKKNAQVVIKKLQGQIQGEGQKRGLLDSEGNIQSNFLSITEQSKHEFKGIKEMLICVAWLKGEHDYTKALDNPAHFLQIVDIGDNFGIQFELDTHLLVRNIDEEDKDNQNRSADIYYTRFKDTFETNKQIYPRLVLLEQEDTKTYENTMADFEELYKMYFKKRFDKLSDYKIYVIDASKPNSKDKTFCFLENGEIDSKYNTIIEYIADFPSKDEDVKYRIVFKNHYETFGKDNQFEVVADNYYLEGISGSNYTHSLLRNGEFDEMKAMRIVESCQTKILVVDERMFEKYKKKPREERKKTFSEDIVNKILERKSEFHDSQSGYDYAKIADVSDEVLNLKKGESVGLSFVTAIQSDEKLKEYLKNFEIVKSIINRKNYNDYFRGKNIDIATYNFSNEKLEFVSERPLNDYHFVSIHYGLIEKFNAAEKEKYANNNIINALASFIKEKIPQNPETQSSFVSIHSGRGDLHKFKDNNHNIITFIPLSGLEWTIENSKYTSTELFYSEIYNPITQKEDEHNK